ncbi:hypothetical protein L2E82_06631 [Cichorium intybus]|uniref:Uncharacterized protein n=1 Tax=Cichorium intybus TaxID=13427 RepID=A0ACB9HA26_CICIN|nr:hypothetical protein L2E82_06631 [Cichorium intybus]
MTANRDCSSEKKRGAAARDGCDVEEERAGGGDNDHGVGGKVVGRKAASKREMARAAADGANSDEIDDCSIERERRLHIRACPTEKWKGKLLKAPPTTRRSPEVEGGGGGLWSALGF